MAAPRERGIRIGGVIRGLVRLSLLIFLGFGLGLVIGLVAEEPALLYGHLMGGGESVPLARLRKPVASDAVEGGAPALSDSNLDSAGRADRFASPAASDRDAKRRVRRQAASPVDLPAVAAAGPPLERAARPIEHASPDMKPTPQARPRDDGRWAIQVGAFSDEAAARRLVKDLESKHYPVAIIPSKGSSQRWRVRVQPVTGEERSRELANRLKRDERLPTWLIPLEVGSRL